MALGLCAAAGAHPANIPVARAKVQPSGEISLEVRFDLLAFLLDETPTLVLDAPMNALLELPKPDLQARLDLAKTRLLESILIADGRIESLILPTAEEVHQFVDKAPGPRLPVMMTVSANGRLSASGGRVSLRFPEILGTVVLTTEFPYSEPISEAVEPGSASNPLQVPSEGEIEALMHSIQLHDRGIIPTPPKTPTEAQARKAIQHRYDSWSKAYMSHDIPLLLDILAPDYTLKTAKGALITRGEYELMLKLRKQRHDDTTQYSTTIQRITVHKGVAAIYARETTTDAKRDENSGRVTRMSYLHDYVDIWLLKDGKWLLKSTVTQRESVLSR